MELSYIFPHLKILYFFERAQLALLQDSSKFQSYGFCQYVGWFNWFGHHFSSVQIFIPKSAYSWTILNYYFPNSTHKSLGKPLRKKIWHILKAASGPDSRAAIFLKKCKAVLSVALFQLWRDCVDQGISPESPKEAHIIPIRKGLASNYRPIALTSVTHHLSVRNWWLEIIISYIVNS